VYLPGTDAWPLPGGQDDRVRDTGANLRLVGGRDTAYARGVDLAMTRAGVPAGADVLLVGHSQGGMTALELAGDEGFTRRYRVTHVVTAGSPAAQVRDLPPRTQALSLENEHDLVPRLDGEPNPDRPNRTTVVFDAHADEPSSIGANHSLAAYRRGARAVDTSGDASLRRYLDSLQDGGYVDSSGERTGAIERFRITREEPPTR
jgi:pimeloyl-ACP methyl ester carboxylesterase